jgi:TRAP-type C4-dicarboxylate transport system permease large subunit
MTRRRLIPGLLALAAVIVVAALVAAANYHDDAPEQAWQFELGTAVVRFGLPALIAMALIVVISTLRNDR